MIKLIVMGLVILFLSGTLYTTIDWRPLQPYMLVGGATLIVFVAILAKLKRFKIEFDIFILFIFFTFFSIVSSLLNGDSELLFGTLLLLFLYVTLGIVLPSLVKDKQKGIELIAISLFLGHLPIIILPLLFGDVKMSSYSGIFYNPNAFGTVVVTLFTVSLVQLTFYLEKYIRGERFRKRAFWGVFFLNSLLIILIIYSSSRTSFIAALTMILVSALFLIRSSNANDKIKLKFINIKYIQKLILLFSLLVFTGALVYFLTPFSDVLYEGIFSKFEMKSDDIFDGRSYVWNSTISEATLFGHGRDYFSTFGQGSHNTFISILGQYGIIPLLFFIIILIQAFIKSIKYLANDSSKYKYLPLLSIILFLMLSMGEGMMLKVSMLLVFSLFGFLGDKSLVS